MAKGVKEIEMSKLFGDLNNFECIKFQESKVLIFRNLDSNMFLKIRTPWRILRKTI